MAMLDIFSKNEVKNNETKLGKVIVDFRERNSSVASELMGLGFKVEFEQLGVGDYIVNDVVIERKTVSDLKCSIINKRIVQQLLELKQCSKYLLLVEGFLDSDIYSGVIHENAFRGFLISVGLDYNVPLVFTHDALDTAKYICVIARKIGNIDSGLRASKIFKNREEQLQFILEGFPYIGPVKARALLKKFGSLKRVFDASFEELNEVLGVRSKEFKEMIDSVYNIKRKK